MKQKSILLMMLVGSLAIGHCSQAQQTVLSPFLGRWEGVLQYLDYQSNDTVGIRATVRIAALPGSADQVVLVFDYPDEPGHGHSDTLSYAGAANVGDDLEWHVGQVGEDAGKKALLLRGYRFLSNELRIWKEVQWDEKPGYFLRNQYLLHRPKL